MEALKTLDYMKAILHLNCTEGFTAKDLQRAVGYRVGIAYCFKVLNKFCIWSFVVKSQERFRSYSGQEKPCYHYWLSKKKGVSYLQVKGIIDEEGNIIDERYK